MPTAKKKKSGPRYTNARTERSRRRAEDKLAVIRGCSPTGMNGVVTTCDQLIEHTQHISDLDEKLDAVPIGDIVTNLANAVQLLAEQVRHVARRLLSGSP
jgi:uncharacterized protein YoxC